MARESATAEWEPYYQEMLNDYLQNIDLQRETVQGDMKLQTQLYELDEGAASRNLTKAISNASEGFAGSGMFFSGDKATSVGELGVEGQAAQERRGAVYQHGQEGYQRQLRGYDIDEATQRRDIARSQETAIEGGILSREEEAAKPYWSNLQMAYARQFPTSGSNVLQGYVPSEYLRY